MTLNLIIATVVIKERKGRPHFYCIKEGVQFNSITIWLQQFSSLPLQGPKISTKCKQTRREEEGLKKKTPCILTFPQRPRGKQNTPNSKVKEK